MKIGLVGCGNISETYFNCQKIFNNFEITTCADIDHEAADKSAPWPENHHPIVRRHPDSGRPALFVDREFTKSIDGLPKEEGKALLAFLFSHVERVDFQCRFRWSENAIAIWDNRCALHHAMWDYYPEERSGRRVSVIGEVPLAWHLGSDQVPASRFAAAKLTI